MYECTPKLYFVNRMHSMEWTELDCENFTFTIHDDIIDHVML